VNRLEYKKVQIGNYIIFSINGEFTISNISEIRELYSELVSKGKYSFIFDLTSTTFIDSSGMGTIFIGTDRTGKNNIKICIDENNENIKELFKIMRVEKVLDFYRNVYDAIEEKDRIYL